MPRTVQPKPTQKTAYVVRAGQSNRSRAVYRGDSASEAHHVARATPGATVTYRTQDALRRYLYGE